MAKIYQFGKFTLNVPEQSFKSDEKVIQLSTKEFEILHLLVANNGQLLTKGAMIDEVWQDTFVEESNLPQYISRLRKILNIDGHEYIKTFSKRGYRFSADVVIYEDDRLVKRQIRLGFGVSQNHEKINEIRQLAVLPFRHLGAQADEDFLGVGIADALITQITRTGHIIVRPTNSILKYQASDRSASEIAYELGVAAILTGNYQRIGNRLRFAIQLSAGEETLWAENFHAEVADIFEIQDKIAIEIYNSLFEKLSAESKINLRKRYTENVDSYQEYLKGRFYFVKRDAESLKKALVHFERAIEIDPLYALAFAGIADVYGMLPIIDEMSPIFAMPKAKAAVLRALEIDSELAEAHTSLGNILLSFEWNWKGAETSFLKAIELNPNYAFGHQNYGTYLMKLGRNADAIVSLKKAQSLDPLSPSVNSWLAECANHLGETEAAIALLSETINFSPNYFPAYYHLVLLYTKAGQIVEAREVTERALQFAPKISFMQSAFAYFYVRVGNRKKATEILNKMLLARKTKYVNAVNIASCFAVLEDKEKALDWLETAAKERDTYLTWINRDEEFLFLRDEPRFIEITSAFES